MQFLCRAFTGQTIFFFQSRLFFFFPATSKRQIPYIDSLTASAQTFYITESQLSFSSRGPILLASYSWTLVRFHYSNTLVTFH